MIKYNFDSLNLEVVKDIVKKSSNYSNVLRELNFSTHSSIRKRLQDYLKKNNIDTSHFTMKQTPFEGGVFDLDLFKDYLKSHKRLDTVPLKEKLFKYGIKERKCERCGRSEWEGEDIPLHLHHINFNHYDNSLENLQILCANCHDQIHHIIDPNKNSIERNYNILINNKTTEEIFDSDNVSKCKICGKIITKGANYCDGCKKKIISENGAPSREELINSFKECRTLVEMGRKYNVTDKVVKRWLRARKLPDHKKELSQYIKENRTEDVTYSEGKTIIKNWEEISYYIKLGYDRGEIANKVNCNEATVKRVADKYNLRIRKRTETLIEQYDFEDNLHNTYYSYNDAARFIIENNLDPKHLNIGIVADIIRSSIVKGKSYCEFIWKTKVLPDINTVEYNKDLYDNPS